MDKKEAQKKIQQMKNKALKSADKAVQTAEKEIARVKLHMDKTAKQVAEFARKNPEKAAMISAGVGAALGAAMAMLIKGGKSGKKSKK